jgi:hypothetical protein
MNRVCAPAQRVSISSLPSCKHTRQWHYPLYRDNHGYPINGSRGHQKLLGAAKRSILRLGDDPFHKDHPTSISSLRPMIRTENAVATAIFVLSNVGYPIRLISAGYPLEIISVFVLRSMNFPAHVRRTPKHHENHA